MGAQGVSHVHFICDSDVHRRLKVLAAERNESMTHLIVEALEALLGKDEGGAK